MLGRPLLTAKEFGNTSILSLSITSKMVTLSKKKVLDRQCVTFSAAAFISNIFRPYIYFACVSGSLSPRHGASSGYG